MGDYIVYRLLEKHIGLMRLMFDLCRNLHINLNLKKSYFMYHLEFCWDTLSTRKEYWWTLPRFLSF
jgi:hypothetical protein